MHSKALWVSRIQPDADTVRKAEERGLVLQLRPELVPEDLDDYGAICCFIAACVKAGFQNIVFPTFPAMVVGQIFEHAQVDATIQRKNPAIAVYGVIPERLMRVGLFLC